ncbi:MAG: fumarylacetoacetate hydrolase family protein [Pseudomonadota bacterium]
MNKVISYISVVVVLVTVLVFLAWVSSEDPKHNPASFEEAPFEVGIRPLPEAITLAQYSDKGNLVTLLVESNSGDHVSGIDLADLGAVSSDNPFEVLRAVEADQLELAFNSDLPRKKVSVTALSPAGPPGNRHIGIGTNFPEHAEEALSDSVFNFPKFGTATPARSTISAPVNGLLDYEVELCMRFDRPIETLADFDAASKGIFLCADFTDRIALLELADFDNLDSGYGFSDAKSGDGFFPTGPLLVIPIDWSKFVADTRMMTLMNGEPRQDARGREMILNFRELTAKVLDDMDKRRFYFQGEYYKLAPNPRIDQDMALMSGTSEGVIFTPPARHDYIEIGLSYFANGGPLTGKSLIEFAIPLFIENERESDHFLKSGDTVTYQATGLGDIKVLVGE